jgi:hypothetical protein
MAGVFTCNWKTLENILTDLERSARTRSPPMQSGNLALPSDQTGLARKDGKTRHRMSSGGP